MLYCASNIVRGVTSRLRWAVYVVRVKDCTSSFKILTGKPAGKRLIGSVRSNWEDNVKIVLK